MKKNFLRMSALCLGGLMMFACSSDDKTPVPVDQEMELTLSVNLDDIVTRAGLEEANDDGTNGACEDPESFDAEAYTAVIVLNPNGDDSAPLTFKKKIRKVNGKFVTDPIALTKPTGTNHAIGQMTIQDGAGTIYWSSVEDQNPDGKYETFVPAEHKTPVEIKWDGDNMESMKKKVMDMTLLCAVNDKPSDFGYGQWGLDLVKVTCLNYSVNVCGDPCDASVDHGHAVGTTTVTIFKRVGTEDQTIFTSSSKAGNIGEICVNDQLSIADKDEIFTIAITVQGYGTIEAEVTGEQIFENYKNSGFWEKPIGQENGYLHFDLCDIDWTKEGYEVPTATGATSPWNFEVSIPQVCDRVCETECGDIFTNWIAGQFGDCKDDCRWETYCGKFTYKLYDGKTSLVTKTESPRSLVTPGNMFKKGDKIKVTFIALESNKPSSLLSLNLIPKPTKPAVFTTEPDTRHGYEMGTRTYCAEITVEEDNCYALSICVHARCERGQNNSLRIINIEKIPASN